MAKSERPLEGGSYIRGKDGKLKKVAGTEPAPPPGTEPEAAAEPASPAGAAEQASTETITPRKGK